MRANPITITGAPCCWGVDDVNNPHLPRWERVLAEAAQAGFGGLELGPYGYIPLATDRVSRALAKHGLVIVAGTLFDDLVAPENRADLLRQTDEICALIRKGVGDKCELCVIFSPRTATRQIPYPPAQGILDLLLERR